MAKDMLSRTIRPGDTVVYPVNTPKGLAMSVAHVDIVISDSLIQLQTMRQDGKSYTFNFSRLDRLAVVGRE